MSKEETMVERVARAAAKAAGNFDYDGFNADTRAKYDRIALAVIDALMEPSDDLLEAAGLDNDNSGAPFVSNFNYFRDQLRAMLSKAKEGTGE